MSKNRTGGKTTRKRKPAGTRWRVLGVLAAVASLAAAVALVVTIAVLRGGGGAGTEPAATLAEARPTDSAPAISPAEQAILTGTAITVYSSPT